MAKDIGSHKDVTVEDLSIQIAILKDDIAALTGSMGDFSKSKAREATEQAKSAAYSYAEAGKDRASEAQQSAEAFVRTQPATAMGIAAGVGFLVGLITARR